MGASTMGASTTGTSATDSSHDLHTVDKKALVESDPSPCALMSA